MFFRILQVSFFLITKLCLITHVCKAELGNEGKRAGKGKSCLSFNPLHPVQNTYEWLGCLV